MGPSKGDDLFDSKSRESKNIQTTPLEPMGYVGKFPLLKDVEEIQKLKIIMENRFRFLFLILFWQVSGWVVAVLFLSFDEKMCKKRTTELIQLQYSIQPCQAFKV